MDDDTEVIMKRSFGLLAACALAAALFAAQAHEPGRDEATVELGKGKVTINYGTPKLNGRNLDEMIQPGTPWRLGMNDPTMLETNVPLDFAGKKLPAGKYTLFARTDEKRNWSLLICSGRTPDTAAVETPLRFTKETSPAELLKITLAKGSQGATLLIAWGTYRLQGSFKAS